MLGDRLRKLRKEKGIQIVEVAEYLGISRQGYGNYENGMREPSMTMLVKLADFYEVSTDYLLGREEQKFVEDVSKMYKVNDKIKVIIKEKSEENKSIKISVKDLLEDPFKNIRKDFTEKGEYLATITGYTDNGIHKSCHLSYLLSQLIYHCFCCSTALAYIICLIAKLQHGIHALFYCLGYLIGRTYHL